MLHRIVSPFGIVVINPVPIIVYMCCSSSSVAEPKKDRARICKRTRVYAYDRCRGGRVIVKLYTYMEDAVVGRGIQITRFPR